jgi:hypothetical protein
MQRARTTSADERDEERERIPAALAQAIELETGNGTDRA